MRNNVSGRKAFKRYLTEGEEVRLFRHVAKHNSRYAKRDLHWMRLLRLTGMRLGSLGALTVGQTILAIESGELALEDSQCKNGKGYDIALSSAAIRELKALLQIRRTMRRESPADAPLIVSQRGDALSERSFQHRMRCWSIGAGIGVEASPHWLRHTYAKRLVARTESPDPLGVVQIALGHGDRRASAIYLMPDREEMRRAAESAA